MYTYVYLSYLQALDNRQSKTWMVVTVGLAVCCILFPDCGAPSGIQAGRSSLTKLRRQRTEFCR